MPARRRATSSHHECIVVGGGLLGLASAWSLSRRGREVLLLDSSVPGHPGSGSKGSARIFRLSYPDTQYIEMAAAARELWHTLEEDSGCELLNHMELLNFGEGLSELTSAMDAVGAPYALLSNGEVRERFPAMDIPGPGLSETTAGILLADECLQALIDTASFAVRWDCEVAHIVDESAGAVVHLTDGDSLSAGVVVNCAGGNSLSLFEHGRALAAAAPSLQQVVYLTPHDPAADSPLFIEWGEHTVYGLPVGPTLKLSHHFPGAPCPSDASFEEDDPELLQWLEDAAVRLLPGFSPTPVATERCEYDNTTDTDFFLDRIGHIVIGCGTSGHGFKFGPLLGELLADLATGAQPQFDIRRFALHRSFLRLLPSP